jgi:hypothetical protein
LIAYLNTITMTVVEVAINRPNLTTSWGFGIGTSDQGICGITHVNSEGYAAGKLHPNDTVNKINGISVAGMVHQDIIGVIMSTTKLRVLVARPDARPDGVSTQYFRDCIENMQVKYRGVMKVKDDKQQMELYCMDLPAAFLSSHPKILLSETFFNEAIDHQLQYGVGMMLADSSAQLSTYSSNIPGVGNVTFEAKHEYGCNTNFVIVSTQATTTGGAKLMRIVQRDSSFVFAAAEEEGPACDIILMNPLGVAVQGAKGEGTRFMNLINSFSAATQGYAERTGSAEVVMESF